MPKEKLEAEREQIDRFKEVARNLGTDEDEEAFKEKLGVIAQQNPKPPKKAPRKS